MKYERLGAVETMPHWSVLGARFWERGKGESGMDGAFKHRWSWMEIRGRNGEYHLEKAECCHWETLGKSTQELFILFFKFLGKFKIISK
jgi:hypothetical protein